VNSAKKLEDIANELKELVSSSSSSSPPHGIDSVTIVPLIQHYSLNLKYEESWLLSLFNSFCSHCLSSTSSSPSTDDEFSVSVRLSTPYTNFSSALAEKSVIKEVRLKKKMLGPDEMSHGFAGGRGIKAFIPQMHLASLLSSLKSSYLRT
jgi:hypothetical protein